GAAEAGRPRRRGQARAAARPAGPDRARERLLLPLAPAGRPRVGGVLRLRPAARAAEAVRPRRLGQDRALARPAGPDRAPERLLLPLAPAGRPRVGGVLRLRPAARAAEAVRPPRLGQDRALARPARPDPAPRPR